MEIDEIEEEFKKTVEVGNEFVTQRSAIRASVNKNDDIEKASEKLYEMAQERVNRRIAEQLRE